MLEVTSLERLKEISKGTIICLPSFDGSDEPFVARVKRPSLLKLMRDGKIPNSLAVKANELFAGKPAIRKDDENGLKDLFKVLDIFAEACLIDPTMEQIKEVGLELTDEQLMALFNFAQKGMDELEKFCKQPKNTSDSQHVEHVQEGAVRNSSHI